MTATEIGSKPIVVQGDGTILLEVENENYSECRNWLSKFAELVKSPEYIHTYKITPLATWNAAASGLRSEKVIETLERFSKYQIPQNIIADIQDWFFRYGKLKLEKVVERKEDSVPNAPDEQLSSLGNPLLLTSSDDLLITEICNNRSVNKFILRKLSSNSLLIDTAHRGRIKNALIKLGYPVEDLVGFIPGDPLPIRLRERITSSNAIFSLREYQNHASEAFYASGSERGGSGVIVMPCGAGKTIVGIDIISKVCQETLIIGSSTVGVRQWISELLEKSHIDRKMIGEYTGDLKELKPITVTTYQCLTHSKTKARNDNNKNKQNSNSIYLANTDQRTYPHLEIFRKKNWGLIIYDEVHLLPAPVFRITAEIQAKRRLGLTATLVREDGMEDDVFSLIGPKKFDSPWKELEDQGWIAEAACYEIRIGMDYDYRMKYATSPLRNKYRIAAENPRKYQLVKQLVSEHEGGEDTILIIGDYINQLMQISSFTNAPIITGKTRNSERERLYSLFRRSELKLLIVSKVANYAIDLPDANVAIQVSGTFGSRQEEAQRLGRILRPKKANKQAYFYTVVSKDTVDQEYASKRQLFLTERGYKYTIVDKGTPSIS